MMSKGSGNLKKKILIGCGIFFLIIVIAFTCLIAWFENMIDDSLSKKEIFELVNENYTLIIDDINKNDFTDTEKLKGVKEVYSDTDVIDVYCGGTGIAPSSQDYGFYYTEDDLPKAIWCGTKYCDESLLVEDGDGYSTDFQHNYYYTEKIRDNFYYYEAHF